MKLKDLSDGIATTCNVRAQVVNAVQAETFKQIRAALDKGERLIVPEFGIFSLRDVPAADGKPAKKVLRLKERSDEQKNKAGKGEGPAGKKGLGRKKKAETEGGSADGE